jgi:WD40 repeat protein
MIITTSWDRLIRTHSELNVMSKNDSRNGILKNLSNAHESEITCADYSQVSGLLATGSKDSEIRIW